jgi:hypothetical protein
MPPRVAGIERILQWRSSPQHYSEKPSQDVELIPMTEGRKHAILFGATLFCARKLIETIESDRPNFAKQYFVDRATQCKA